MRTLASALIALAVLVGVTASVASAATNFDSQSFFKQQERNLP